MIKKIILLIVWIISVMASFFIGLYINRMFESDDVKNLNSIVPYENDDLASRKEGLVGVYQTDSWNGESAIMVLYEDGTSQYPSGGKSTWVVDGENVVISVAGIDYDSDKRELTAHFDHSVTFDEMQAITDRIAIFDNVESIEFIGDEYDGSLYIKLINGDEDNEFFDTISSINGLYSVEYEWYEVETISDHMAKIMENGLVLHGKYFEKVSN